MSGKYAVPLELELRPSRLLGGWLLLTHAGSLAVLPVVSHSFRVTLAVTLVVLCSLLHAWRAHVVRRHPQAIRSLSWGEGRRCRLGQASGREVEAALVPQAVVLPLLTILHFSGRGHRRHCLVLLPDMLDPDRFRQLRVRLKIELNS